MENRARLEAESKIHRHPRVSMLSDPKGRGKLEFTPPKERLSPKE